MKFEIKSRWTGEIDANEDTFMSIKLGLAVKKAVEVKANLYGANLYGANLWVSGGNNRHVKSLQAGAYLVSYTDTVMQIGCRRHAIEDWWNFDDARIAEMDGRTALKFWRTWKPILQAVIAASPADPTGYVAPETQVAAE